MNQVTENDSMSTGVFKTSYIPKSKDGFFSKSGEAGSDAEDEGQDTESCVDRDQGSAETSGALIADQQQEETEEADCVL